MENRTKELELVAYLRVSTGQQKADNTIENQRRAIEGFLSYHDNIKVVKWYEDDGISAFDDRPDYNLMMENVDRYDGIIIAKLSRIGRKTSQLLDVAKMLSDKRKEFIVVNDNIDTTSPQGTFFFTILAAFNEYEASLIRERMNEGRKRYTDNGGKLGRKRLEFGEKTGVTPRNKELIDLYNNGYGLTKLAKMFCVSRDTIRTRLLEAGVILRKAKGFN